MFNSSERGMIMKFFSYALVTSLLLSGVSLTAKDVKRMAASDETSENATSENPSAATWYDEADRILEKFAGASQILYADAASYKEWTQKLSNVMEQLNLQEQLQDQLFQYIQAGLDALVQKIKELEAGQQAEILQAKQEQFDVDGQKASELIGVIEGLKRDFSGIIIPEKEALFMQLERLTCLLKEQIQKNALQAQELIQVLQEYA